MKRSKKCKFSFLFLVFLLYFFIKNKRVFLAHYVFLMWFRDILFPIECVICRERGNYLCKTCKAKLQSYPEVCTLCNTFSQDFKICPWCKRANTFFLKNIFVGFYYNSIIKNLILKLKYQHRYHVAHFLAERLNLLLEIHLGHHITAENTIIIGVASHRKRRLLTKWYNQSEYLAQELANISKIPYKKIIKKTRHTPSQVKLNRVQRLKNLHSAFSLVSHHETILTPEIKHIIIVDDITTTGSSLNEVARTINQCFPHIQCYGMVIAKK